MASIRWNASLTLVCSRRTSIFEVKTNERVHAIPLKVDLRNRFIIDIKSSFHQKWTKINCTCANQRARATVALAEGRHRKRLPPPLTDTNIHRNIRRCRHRNKRVSKLDRSRYIQTTAKRPHRRERRDHRRFHRNKCPVQTRP